MMHSAQIPDQSADTDQASDPVLLVCFIIISLTQEEGNSIERSAEQLIAMVITLPSLTHTVGL